MNKQLFALIALTAPLMGSQTDQSVYDSVKSRLEARADYYDLALRANTILKGAYSPPKYDYRDTCDAMETADKMRKEAILHYDKALRHLSELPDFDLKGILDASIKESCKTVAHNPRERLIKYVTAMAIEFMSRYGVDAISSLTAFSYEVIHATTLMESAEEITKIAPSLAKLYNDDWDHLAMINATMALVNIDLYTYTFINPKDGMAASNFFKSVREDFFLELKKNKKMRHCLCYDMLFKVRNFNLMSLSLINTPREYSAQIIELGLKAAEDLFSFESQYRIPHSYVDEFGNSFSVEDFFQIEWMAYP